ncbi:neuronal PAS domain-containing protein 1-like isoform X2 [Polyodon spathula]|uniref:neuronal PAS domain-containing protein 1-like isoform X2 n=1 Tax=Polyodon spathula TaxID=7913 RepID=UPI001B7EE527|nr:neuronal PAS domain-containing protein 1-like isoform X2 [Polyodon spathula]
MCKAELCPCIVQSLLWGLLIVSADSSSVVLITFLSAKEEGNSISGAHLAMPGSLQSLRKEKSRNAARSRRGKENFEFFELAKMLPLPGAITSQLDKASVIRLSISYLRMRDFCRQGEPSWSPVLEGGPHNKAVGRTPMSLATDLFEHHLGGHLLQSLDGFAFVVSHEGRFLYISETVSIYLGLSQVELTGSSVFDYIHPADHVEMAERLGMRSYRGRGVSQATNENTSSSASTSSLAETPEPEEDSAYRSFFIRMKSTLTKRGLHIKSSGYKVIHVTGRIRSRPTHSPAPSVQRELGLVALAHTLPPSTLTEVRMESHMFVFRVNMDLQVIYCENRIKEYMDLSPEELIGQNCYHFIHVEDVDSIRHSHEDLLVKGQVVTGYYRWLQRRGGFLWIQSCATISFNHKSPQDRNIIWVNYVLSRPELLDIPLDLQQLGDSPGLSRKPQTTDDWPQEDKGKDTTPLQNLDSGNASKIRAVSSRGSQSEEMRKRSRRCVSVEGPLETRAKGNHSPLSSELESESESEREAEPLSKHIKVEERRLESGGSEAEEEEEEEAAGRIPNGCAVIQHRKFPSTSSYSEHEIKTELTGSDVATSEIWGLHSLPCTPLDTEPETGQSHGNGPRICIPDSVLTPPGEDAPPKALFTPSVEAVSPPLSASPLSREERLFPAPSMPDFELLQRLGFGGGVRGLGGISRVVLPLPRSMGGPTPHSLYAPSTIRYAPAELHLPQAGARHQRLSMQSPDLQADPKPPPLFPPPQRLSGLPPFSGFTALDTPFSALSFSINGLRGPSTDKDEN